MGFIVALPALKSIVDNLFHRQWVSWLLLVIIVGVPALLCAVLVVRWFREMGPDKKWRMVTWILISIIALVVSSDLAFAGVAIFKAGKTAGSASAVTKGHGGSGADHGGPSPAPTASLLSVQLAVGSENVPFFRNPQVQKIFRENGYDVQATGFGSRQMATIDFTKYDAVIPSSQITASQLEAGPLKYQPEIPLFQSPLAIATYQPIATCLNSLGIASRDSQGIWEFSVQAYLAAVKRGRSWSDCPSSLSPLTGKILVTTTNPQCSNSGEVFMADASYVAYGTGSAVPDKGTATRVGGELAPVITGQGFMPWTTDVVFNDYLVTGMDYTPMALIYESEFIGEEITNPGAMKPDMVLMYLTPNVFSQRWLIPLPHKRDSRGAAVGQLIASNPDLQRLAQEQYGFRYSNPAAFQRIIGSHRIFGKQITVPVQFVQAKVPDDPSIIEDVINAVIPPHPANNAPTC